MANKTTNTTTTTKTKEQLEKEELEFKRRIDAQFQAFLDWAEKNKHISETTKKKLIETLTDKYEWKKRSYVAKILGFREVDPVNVYNSGVLKKVLQDTFLWGWWTYKTWEDLRNWYKDTLRDGLIEIKVDDTDQTLIQQREQKVSSYHQEQEYVPSSFDESKLKEKFKSLYMNFLQMILTLYAILSTFSSKKWWAIEEKEIHKKFNEKTINQLEQELYSRLWSQDSTSSDHNQDIPQQPKKRGDSKKNTEEYITKLYNFENEKFDFFHQHIEGIITQLKTKISSIDKEINSYQEIAKQHDTLEEKIKDKLIETSLKGDRSQRKKLSRIKQQTTDILEKLRDNRTKYNNLLHIHLSLSSILWDLKNMNEHTHHLIVENNHPEIDKLLTQQIESPEHYDTSIQTMNQIIIKSSHTIETINNYKVTLQKIMNEINKLSSKQSSSNESTQDNTHKDLSYITQITETILGKLDGFGGKYTQQITQVQSKYDLWKQEQNAIKAITLRQEKSLPEITWEEVKAYTEKIKNIGDRVQTLSDNDTKDQQREATLKSLQKECNDIQESFNKTIENISIVSWELSDRKQTPTSWSQDLYVPSMREERQSLETYIWYIDRLSELKQTIEGYKKNIDDTIHSYRVSKERSLFQDQLQELRRYKEKFENSDGESVWDHFGALNEFKNNQVKINEWKKQHYVENKWIRDLIQKEIDTINNSYPHYSKLADHIWSYSISSDSTPSLQTIITQKEKERYHHLLKLSIIAWEWTRKLSQKACMMVEYKKNYYLIGSEWYLSSFPLSDMQSMITKSISTITLTDLRWNTRPFSYYQWWKDTTLLHILNHSPTSTHPHQSKTNRILSLILLNNNNEIGTSSIRDALLIWFDHNQIAAWLKYAWFDHNQIAKWLKDAGFSYMQRYYAFYSSSWCNLSDTEAQKYASM